MKKIIATTTCVIGIFFAAWAIAGQSSLFSPTTGTVSGLQLTNNFNAAIDSVNTCNSGTSAPTNQLSGSPSKGNCWLDTSVAGQASLKYYDGTQWLVSGVLDTTSHVWQDPIGGGVFIYAGTTGGAADVCAVAQNIIEVAGASNLSSFGSGTGCSNGQVKVVDITGGFTMINSASLLLPGGANIQVQNGDIMFVGYVGSGVFAVAGFTAANAVTCSGTPSSSFSTRAGLVTHC